MLFAVLLANTLTLTLVRMSRPWVIHHRDMQATLSRLRATLVDAETGQQGFLLTGDPAYLERFNSCEERLPAILDETVRLAAADDPPRQRVVAELKRLSVVKVAEIRQTVDLYQSGEIAAAIAIVRDKDGKALMEQVRRIIAEVRSQEDKQLDERTASQRARLDSALWIAAGAGIGLLALGVMLYVIHRDIARREVLENALREEARFQQEVLGILSHDLRSPLSAISMTASRLAAGERRGAEADAVRRIGSSAARMGRMIDQLLDVTRARFADGIPIDPKSETNLSELVTTAAEEIRAAHPNAQIGVDALEDVRGRWDPDRLAQVVSNLISNAVLHGDGTVDVRVHRSDAVAILEVHNGGAPISAEILPRIFEPFRRASHTTERRSQGLGLGLFIAERIVQAHGGTIEVRSTNVEGTTFIMHLPCEWAPLSQREPALSLAARSPSI